MTTPRITAIITAHNYGHFIGEAVESVLHQGFSPAELEVVVVDDGSTDDTPERVRKFGDRIVYIRKSNGGQASALNAGFANAHGEIFALLDADDVWLPNKLRRVCETFDRRPDAIAVQHLRSIWNSQNGATGMDPELPDTSRVFPLPPADLLRHGFSPTSAVAYRKTLLAEILPVPGTLTGHADSYLSALAVLIAPVVSLNEPLSRYRIHGGNLYSFEGADAARSARRLAQMETFVAEVERAVRARQENYAGEGLEGYLRRFHLSEETHRFAARGAARREFFQHLRRHNRVYGPLWTRRYLAFRGLLPVAGFVLGYERFEGLRRRYRNSGAALRVRAELFPCGAPR